MTTYGNFRALAAPILLGLTLSCIIGCSKSTTRAAEGASDGASSVRTAQLGDTVSLRRGESVLFGGDIFLTFGRVIQDSRCPEDVKCVWAGNARVELSMRKSGGAAVTFVLNTGVPPRDTTIGGYDVALHALAPRPNSHHVIEPDEYVASVSVGR